MSDEYFYHAARVVAEISKNSKEDALSAGYAIFRALYDENRETAMEFITGIKDGMIDALRL